MEKIKISFPARNQNPDSLIIQSVGQSICRVSYPGSQIVTFQYSAVQYSTVLYIDKAVRTSCPTQFDTYTNELFPN
jgi:hypothetical protein